MDSKRRDVLKAAAATPVATAAGPAAAHEQLVSITIRRPDDWHVHLRDGAMLKAVLPYTATQFARGIIMPNLVPPVTTVAAAAAYRERILAARPSGSDFQPLMTCYLTDTASPGEIERGFAEGIWAAAKLYPAGATTNSHHGVADIPGLAPVLERMEKISMPVLVHGEATDPTVDVFDREAVFMEQSLLPLLKRHQGLKLVVEHVTTAETIDVVRAHAPRVAGTITPHHLIINRTSIFQGGLRPHLYCLPVAKRERHRIALRKAATSGDGCFFIGTDTAPHVRRAKEAACGCAGVFVGATALQSYVQVFDEESALDRFETFASLNGARFYGLQPNAGKIELIKRPSRQLEAVTVGEEEVVIFRGGEDLPWSVGTVSLCRTLNRQ
jgi:dihydroorotase